MPTSHTTHDRSLTPQQQTILNTLYKFRFLTAALLTDNLSANQRVISKRLKKLVDQGYLNMNYDSSYKIGGRPATYFLATKAVRYLRTKPYTNESALRSIYHDKRASEAQITHHLNVFSAYVELKHSHPERFKFFSNTELIGNPYVPKDRPDAYIIDTKTGQNYFLECLEDTMNSWTIRKAFKRYVRFAEAEEWQKYKEDSQPAILLLCESERLAKRISRIVENELDSSYAELECRVTSCATSLFPAET